ncbi:site-specific integrase [Methylorubrum salsuginis]|uniref:Site-specific recombinase XerC n=1 Tax=Methylorubrum salsuginis TaxID=414703 RepID=A0A1I4MA45_9HYPH|nr:site-specific integrase [Methylorubrum salsuginis]SFL99953.1 Site-specific recombinase XerC [Methylorubrum salsuginis]
MILAMSRPHLHPRSRVYWLRKRVPAELVAVVGRREITFSLKTRDPEEAKRRYAEELLKLEHQWASLRKGKRTLTEREAHDVAAEIFDHWLAEHRDYPSRQTFWRTDLGDSLWRSDDDPDMSVLDRGRAALERARAPETNRREMVRVEMRDWCREQAEALASGRGLILDAAGQDELTRAVAAAVQRACLALERGTRGEPLELAPPKSADATSALALSHAIATAPTSSVRAPLSFGTLIEAWAAEATPATRTRYEWTRVIDKLAAFIGHDDAHRLTQSDVVRWKEHLVASGQSSKTIRDASLSAVKSILGWGVRNGRLETNPAAAVTIDVRRKAGQGIRGFSDDEAATILRAAAQEADPVRRWIPWLCAFSGARLAEACQLRAEDVMPFGSVWAMRFDAAAGPIKNTNSERTIPVHSALIEQGFLAFAQGTERGPLFPGLPPDKFGKRGGTATKRLGPWVRSLGLIDERLSPNHSWRHRFKTLARRHELRPDTVDAITGHGKRAVGDTYGEHELKTMQRELEKIPNFIYSGA